MRSRSASLTKTRRLTVADDPDRQRRLDVDALDMIARHLGGTLHDATADTTANILDAIAMIIRNTGRTIPGEEQ